MLRPLENFGSIDISTPFSSKGLRILKTANTLAITAHTDVSAKCLPTQIRRPNPNAICSMSLGLREPLSPRNRSGMNDSGLGYLDSSFAIDLPRQIIKGSVISGLGPRHTDHRLDIKKAPVKRVLITFNHSKKIHFTCLLECEIRNTRRPPLSHGEPLRNSGIQWRELVRGHSQRNNGAISERFPKNGIYERQGRTIIRCGNLFLPTMASIWVWAFSCASGCTTIIRKNVIRREWDCFRHSTVNARYSWI